MGLQRFRIRHQESKNILGDASGNDLGEFRGEHTVGDEDGIVVEVH